MKSVITAAIIAVVGTGAHAFDPADIFIRNHCAETSNIMRTAALSRELGTSFDSVVNNYTEQWQRVVAASAYVSGENTKEYQQEMYQECVNEFESQKRQN
jgi:hypothetical protein